MKTVIVVDGLEPTTGRLVRRVFDPDESEDAHERARHYVRSFGRGQVTLKIAHMNDDGYIVEGFKEV